MTYALRLLCALMLFSVGGLFPVSAQGAAKENVILILDVSGSMWGRVDGREKILVAREVVGSVLADIGERVNMGIVAYGHRRKGD